MWHNSRAASRYAAALDAAALAAGSHAQVLDDVESIAGLALTSPELQQVLVDRSIPRGTRARVIDRLFGDRVHPLTRRFLGVLAYRRRLALLPEAAAAMRERAERRAGVRRVAVAVAREPGPVASAHLAEGLRRAAGGDVAMTVAVRPELVGGFTARIGDTLVDLSVAGALRAFRRRVTDPAGEAARARPAPDRSVST